VPPEHCDPTTNRCCTSATGSWCNCTSATSVRCTSRSPSCNPSRRSATRLLCRRFASHSAKSCWAASARAVRPVGRDHRLHVQDLDDLGDVLRQRFVVVDDQDRAGHAGGKVSRKLAPAGLVSSSLAPPWASMMRRHRANPRPLPLALVVNRASKIRRRSSSGTPGPSSRMCRCVKPFGSVSPSTHRWPRPPWPGRRS
jgi:hypothetical protein